MCCKGSEIQYKDYTPMDQQNVRQAYNQSLLAPGGKLQGATQYGMQNPFLAQMNMLMPMAMQAMYGAGGGQGQIQLPGYATWGQVSGQPYKPVPQVNPMQNRAGGGFMGMGGVGSQGPGMGGSYPYWLNMPGQPQPQQLGQGQTQKKQ